MRYGKRKPDYKRGPYRPSGYTSRDFEPSVSSHGENHQYFIAGFNRDKKLQAIRKRIKEQGLKPVVITQEQINKAKQEFYKKQELEVI